MVGRTTAHLMLALVALLVAVGMLATTPEPAQAQAFDQWDQCVAGNPNLPPDCWDYMCQELGMQDYCGGPPAAAPQCPDPALTPPDCLPANNPVACAGGCPSNDPPPARPPKPKPKPTKAPVDSSTAVAGTADDPDPEPAPTTEIAAAPAPVRMLPLTGTSIVAPLIVGLGVLLGGLGAFLLAKLRDSRS